MDPDASVPLPDRVARQMSAFHRVMRSTKLGHIVFVLIVLGLAIKPLISAAPFFLLLAWVGVFRVRGMQRFFDHATGWFMAAVIFCLEVIYGIRIRTFGHRDKFQPRSLFIMNHLCHFDWMFFWGVVERHGDLTTWKVITKVAIKKLPILGICMQYMCHIFINRRWGTDEKEFKKKLFYYNALNLPLQLLLFPEGKDLTQKSKSLSDIYADTNGVKRYEYCLHPRARGFTYVMQALRSGGLDAVYDITVGYPDALAKTEGDFLRGDCIPREIHYNIRCYQAKDLPTDEQELTQWLEERWREKEESLKLFHIYKRFVTKGAVGSGSNGISVWQNGHSVEYLPVPEATLPKSYFYTFFGIGFYLFIIGLFSFLFYLHWIWRCFVLCLTVFTFAKGLYGSGIDNVLPDKIPDKIEAAYKKCHRSVDNT